MAYKVWHFKIYIEMYIKIYIEMYIKIYIEIYIKIYIEMYIKNYFILPPGYALVASLAAYKLDYYKS